MNEEMKVFFKETISDLESNIHYKNDLKYIKIKIQKILRKYNIIIKELNREIDELKLEVRDEFIIRFYCPYCRNIIRLNKNLSEITCPKCLNLIEIDVE